MPERLNVALFGPAPEFQHYEVRPLGYEHDGEWNGLKASSEYIRHDLHAQLLKRAEKMEAALREIAEPQTGHDDECDDEGDAPCECHKRIARAALTDQEGS